MSFYREVILDNTGGAAKSSWPVKVALTAANFDFSSVESDGSNIEFRASDGTMPLDYWRQDFDSGAETATFWVKVPTIGAGASLTVRMYYGAGITDRSDGAATFPTLFEDFDDLAAITTDFTQSQLLGNLSRFPANPFITLGGAGSWKEGRLHEVGNIVFDPDDADANRRYKLYFSARATFSDAPGDVGVAFSPDGLTWTEYGSNPIILNHEDAYVVRVSNGVWHLWAEDGTPTAGDIDHYTSADGITWTADVANNPVIDEGDDGAWTSEKVGSPCVYYDGTNFHMIFDGRGADTVQSIGVAHSANGATWTFEATNPIIVAADLDGVAADSVVPTDITLAPDDTTYIALIHDGSSTPGVLTTTDAPAGWDSDSFTQVGTFIQEYQEATVHSNDHSVVWEPDAGTGLYLADILGGVGRTFALINSTVRTLLQIKFDAYDSELVLTPYNSGGTSAHSLMLAMDANITNNFALCYRMKKVNLVTRQAFARVGFGSGAIVSGSGNAHWGELDNGYSFLYGDASADSRFEEANSGTNATLGATVAMTNFGAYSNYEMRYQADGTLALLRDGASILSRSDSTHVASSKDVFVTQGHSSNSTSGAISTWDWFFVRPFDGVDPSITVDSEENEGDVVSSAFGIEHSVIFGKKIVR